MVGHILLSHGSRLKSSNDFIFDIFKKLEPSVQNLEIAFLELCEPTLEDAIKTLSVKGIKKVIILPLFVSAGRHIQEDLPLQIVKLEQIYDIKILVLDFIGKSDGFLTLIRETFKTTPSF